MPIIGHGCRFNVARPRTFDVAPSVHDRARFVALGWLRPTAPLRGLGIFGPFLSRLPLEPRWGSPSNDAAIEALVIGVPIVSPSARPVTVASGRMRAERGLSHQASTGGLAGYAMAFRG
jgi:hypothetical protein